jgi:hypothetical protein
LRKNGKTKTNDAKTEAENERRLKPAATKTRIKNKFEDSRFEDKIGNLQDFQIV